jgi:hypothetical protein
MPAIVPADGAEDEGPPGLAGADEEVEGGVEVGPSVIKVVGSSSAVAVCELDVVDATVVVRVASQVVFVPAV